MLSSDLGISAVSIDDVIKDRWGTILGFQSIYDDYNSRMVKKASLVMEAASIEGDVIIDVSPIWQHDLLAQLMEKDDVLSILLIDRVEHVLEYLVFTDDNDVIEPHSDLTPGEYRYYLKDLASDMLATILYNGEGLSVIYDINGRSVDEVCKDIKKLILAGRKPEKKCCLLQKARMFYNRTLNILAQYSVDAGLVSYYYDMVFGKYGDRHL